MKLISEYGKFGNINLWSTMKEISRTVDYFIFNLYRTHDLYLKHGRKGHGAATAKDFTLMQNDYT